MSSNRETPVSFTPPRGESVKGSLKQTRVGRGIDKRTVVLGHNPKIKATFVSSGNQTLSAIKRQALEQMRQDRFYKKPEVKAILERLAPWCGSLTQAKAWFEAEKIPALGNRTAKQTVEQGHAGAVFDFLDHAASGGFA